MCTFSYFIEPYHRVPRNYFWAYHDNQHQSSLCSDQIGVYTPPENPQIPRFLIGFEGSKQIPTHMVFNKLNVKSNFLAYHDNVHQCPLCGNHIGV